MHSSSCGSSAPLGNNIKSRSSHLLLFASVLNADCMHGCVPTRCSAPWCKQCKLLRDAYEAAAQAGVPGVTFGRIDCVKYPNVKEHYKIYSYPALKVLRGARHRWLYTPKQRTAQMITAAAAAEADGAYRLLESSEALRSAVHEQLIEKGCDTASPKDQDATRRDPTLCAGVGEAAVIALLSSSHGALAASFGVLAAGGDMRLSPTPYLATTRPDLLPLLGVVGLEALQPDHLAALTFNERWASFLSSPTTTWWYSID